MSCDFRAVRNETKDKILAIKEKYPHFNPHLAMIQVGAREDSSIYVKMKDKAAKEVCCIGTGCMCCWHEY